MNKSRILGLAAGLAMVGSMVLGTGVTAAPIGSGQQVEVTGEVGEFIELTLSSTADIEFGTINPTGSGAGYDHVEVKEANDGGAWFCKTGPQVKVRSNVGWLLSLNLALDSEIDGFSFNNFRVSENPPHHCASFGYDDITNVLPDPNDIDYSSGPNTANIYLGSTEFIDPDGPIWTNKYNLYVNARWDQEPGTFSLMNTFTLTSV